MVCDNARATPTPGLTPIATPTAALRCNGHGAWTAVASMAAQRILHTATVLADGRVLVAGGDDKTETLNSAELFDPTTDTWTTAASMITKRRSHTATLLKDGRVLVTGGINRDNNGGFALNDAELYDPGLNTWSIAAPMTFRRESHTATALTDGSVLVAGGENHGRLLDNVEVYHPTTNTWTPTTSMSTAHYQHTATSLSNGDVLVVGGIANVGELGGAELYDATTNSWSVAGQMVANRWQHTATLLPSGVVLVAGGSMNIDFASVATAELYDPTLGIWSPAAPMSVARKNHTATLLFDGRILVAGGFDVYVVNIVPGEITYVYYNNVVLSSAESYVAASNSWTGAGLMANARGQHTATFLGDGRVLVAGGGFNDLATAEIFDPSGRCVGDCDGDGNVSIDEIITLVNAAVGNAQGSTCPCFAVAGLDVATIIQGVHNGVYGCGGG